MHAIAVRVPGIYNSAMAARKKSARARRRSFVRALAVPDWSVVREYRSFAEADAADLRYWRTRTPVERMIALEHLRQLAWGYNDRTRPQLRGTPGMLKLRRSRRRG
jgi:hypothetical protein